MSDMYYPASENFADKYPDQIKSIESLDRFIAEIMSSVFTLGSASDLTEIELGTLRRLLRLYEAEEVVARKPLALCPIHHERLETRESGELFCEKCNATYSWDEAVPIEAYIRLQTTTKAIRRITVFDVFLCHNSDDKPAIREISKQLKARGIQPWLDEEQLIPGHRWQQELELQIKNIKAAAVFVGNNGLGPWQSEEMYAFLRQFVDDSCPVIPVLLKDCPEKPTLPVFLTGRTWVDFREIIPDPLEQLVRGIKGS